MPFMQSAAPLGTDSKPYRAALLGRAMAAGTTGKLDPDMAIMARDEGDQTIFLLSPAAAKYAHGLPGDWTEAADAKDHAWRMIYDVDISLEDLGLKAEG